ncbi:MAG TPA: hypothetical protein PKZ43_01345 [Bacteroidales bacterium]|nr:hypothetical protein [Bacteroidales bacterium]HQH18170.1 hypothetical protein [Bacteroidales bacterium]HQI44693.1 hypothetical protein [Bacteroidales bacterium]
MNKRNKFGYLVLGVFIGILSMYSVVWWKESSIRDWKWVYKFKYYYNNIFDRNEEKNIISNEQGLKNKKQNHVQQKSNPKKDTFSYTEIPIDNQDAWDEFIANYKGELTDSLLIDSILKFRSIKTPSYTNQEENEVKKDRLVFSSTYYLSNFSGFTKDDSNERDSLFQSNKNKNTKEKNLVVVEFWESPINYKGYRTKDHKIILFGIDYKEPISFILHNNIVYLKVKSVFYSIENTVDYKMLIAINNPQLLSQLNNQ